MVGDLPLSWVPIPFLWGSDRTLPIMRPVASASKGKVYFHFGKPIRTDHPDIKGRDSNPKVVGEIRDATKDAIEKSLDYLREFCQREDKGQSEHSPSRVAQRGRVVALARWLRRAAATNKSNKNGRGSSSVDDGEDDTVDEVQVEDLHGESGVELSVIANPGAESESSSTQEGLISASL